MAYGLMSWSGGKDAALAYYYLLKNKAKVVSLLTNVYMPANETPIHRLPFHMIELQAMRLGIPVQAIYHSEQPDNPDYENQWEANLEHFKSLQLDFIGEGDIHLEDIMAYKAYIHQKSGYRSRFPLKGKDTYEVVKDFLRLGFKAKVIAVNAEVLSQDWVGVEYDQAFLAELPAEIDPAGEDGAFHTYVYDGPIFKKPIHVEFGEKYQFRRQGTIPLDQWNIRMRGF